MKILILLSLILLTACSRSEEEVVSGEDSPRNRPVIPITPDTLEDLSLTAAREYNPNFWKSTTMVATTTGRYQVPDQLTVAFGNSARGWASLRIKERVFCYRGNASSNSTLDGDAFVLKHEKRMFLANVITQQQI